MRALSKFFHGKQVAVGTATADASSTLRPLLLLPVNETRSTLVLYNDGAADVFITFKNVTDEGKIKIPAGNGMKLTDPAPRQSVYAFTAAGTSSLSVFEA